MSALALDEFTLEMRTHYLETTLQTLHRCKEAGDFQKALLEVIPDWMIEAGSNQMPELVKGFQSLRELCTQKIFSKEVFSGIAESLEKYLTELKSQEDSASLAANFHACLQRLDEPEVGLFLQCLCFEHRFVVPVKNVIEISGGKHLSPLPFPQKKFKGLIAFRGQAIPVMALENFGFLSNGGALLKSFYVICNFDSNIFALEVHSTEDVIEISSKEFQNADTSILSSPAVRAFTIRKESPLMLLDLEMLVNHG